MIDLIRQMAGTVIPVRRIVEHVLMDRDPEDVISKAMGGRPTKIPAGPVCASNRDRLLWIDVTSTHIEGEKLVKGKFRNELTLQTNPQRLDFLDAGWGPAPSSEDPCVPCKVGKNGPVVPETTGAST